MSSLLTVGDAKTSKGESLGYLTGILYLAPADVAGRGNVCPMATEGCRAACLYSAGRGAFTATQSARVRKTEWYFADREGFLRQVARDIGGIVRAADRRGMIPAIRLNGTSDIQWERQRLDGRTLFEMFPDVQFYDYTKIYGRFSRPLPANYHLTASYVSERAGECLDLVENRVANVARVYRNKCRPSAKAASWDLPGSVSGVPLVNGDAHDLRFLDPGPGYWIGLKAKGTAWRDTSGFVTSI